MSLLPLHNLVGGASGISGGDFLEVPGGHLSHGWEEGMQPSRSCDETAQALGCLCDAVFLSDQLYRGTTYYIDTYHQGSVGLFVFSMLNLSLGTFELCPSFTSSPTVMPAPVPCSDHTQT